MLKTALLRMTDEFSPLILTRARDFQQQGHVLHVRLSDGLLKARVKGQSGQLFDVHIDLKSWPGSSSRCTCQNQTACEHAAACLLELQARELLPATFQIPDRPVSTWFDTSVSSVPEEILEVDDFAWFSEVEGSEHDFFAYRLGILVDGKPVSIVPLVVDLLRQRDLSTLERLPDNHEIKLPLSSRQVLRIKLGRIKPLLRFVVQYSQDQKEGASDFLKLRRYQLMLLQEAELAIAAVSARWQGTEEVQRRLYPLTQLTELPQLDIPAGLNAVLRPYQHQGFNWLQFLRTQGLAGILADDMGLGKTIQALAQLQYEKEQGRLKKPSLVIAPTSLVENWFVEALRFTPALKVLVFHGAGRYRDQFDDYDLIISTYGLVQRDKKRFMKYQFYYLILDEAQFIKNARTKTTQIVLQLQAKYRLCLTGTPLENHLGELWSLFHFLMPGLLGNAKQFGQYFRNPIEKNADQERQRLLMKRIQPFILRRTKNRVADELPEKTEMVRMIELSGNQRDLYEAVRISMEKKVRDAINSQGMGKSQILLLDALLKLRQVCCDPKLLSLPEASMAHGHSAKLDILMELIDNLMDEERHVLVFSQFTSMLKLIEEKLTERNYPYFKLTGQTQHRQSLVDRFQAGEVPIFLISLKAGGTGLNLTRADTVILYDPWWNPAVQNQAMDRSHRIGQKNPVFVYKLITTGTVEETILSMQDKKKQLFDGVLSNESSGQFHLTETDIGQFFMPL